MYQKISACHIVNHITGKADGVYAHLNMIFSHSDKNKFQHYLIFQGGEKIEVELSKIGIKYLVCGSLKKKISIKAFFDIYKFIKENDITIVHTHLIKPYVIAGLLNIFQRKKFIFNYHGLFIYKNIFYGFSEKLFYSLTHFIINFFNTVDVVLVPSQKSKELLLAETKLFPEPVVYYNGYNLNETKVEIDHSLFSFIEKLKSENILIAVSGRLDLDKRIDRAINIFKNVSDKVKNVHLLIFGDGKLEGDLKKLAKDLDLSERINFMGYVPGMSSYLNLIDIILLTSDWEGMPLIMWEAMAHKVPVLAPDVGGLKEILLENKCGFIFNPGDIKDAESKLLELIENVPLRKQLGENGIKVIKQKYNSEIFIKQLENIYSKLSS